jgi:hypothetical protein
MLDFHAVKITVDFIQVHLETICHILANLGKNARHGRQKADAEFFLRRTHARCQHQ